MSKHIKSPTGSDQISKRKDNFDDEIWSVNRIKPEKYFSSKLMENRRQGY